MSLLFQTLSAQSGPTLRADAIIIKTKRFAILTVKPRSPKSAAENIEDVTAKYVWLSKRLLNVTKGSTSINFSADVLITIESDIQKCRETRQLFQNLDFQKYGVRILTEVCNDSFKLLTTEIDIKYDTSLYPIGESFALMLGIEFNNLPSLHKLYSNDLGRLKDRHEKRRLLQSIADPSKRNPFQSVFIDFILRFIAPHVRSITQSSRIYFQCFPCIRVVRPGEFSIGPHCDASYGFSQGNINFYVPLTKIFGTNSLILESSPGLEDWHTIELDYGEMKRFYGSQCSHFTAENTTAQTRISLDFRVILEDHWQEDHDHFTSTPGYYSSCKYVPFSKNNSPEGKVSISELRESDNILESVINLDIKINPSHQREMNTTDSLSDNSNDMQQGRWILEGDLLEPDWRVGFPFEKQSVPAPHKPSM